MCRNLTNNSVKKMCALLLVFLLAAGTLAGCAKDEGTPSGKASFDFNPMVLETSSITVNPLSFEEISVYSNGEPREVTPPSFYEYDQMDAEEKKYWQEKEVFFSGNYLRIDGLKDKEVQDKINEKIKKLYFDNIGYLPPYRGVKVVFGENPKLRTNTYSTMSMYVENNFNNILSITLNCSIPYEYKDAGDKEYNYEYVGWVAPLNIDLNTGEEIALQQVFRDNVDAIEYLNSYFTKATSSSYDSESLWGSGDEIQLVGRFDTLPEDQKYSIAPYGLRLILDYSTPAADIGFYFQSLTVPYSNEMALFDRFFSEKKNIYTSENTREKNLLIPEIYLDQRIEESDVIDGIEVYRRASYSEKMPKAVTDKIIALYEEDQSGKIAEMKPHYQEALQELTEENVYAENRYTIDVGIAGHFIALFIGEYAYVGGNDGVNYREFYSQQKNLYETYDLKAKKTMPMALEDIFVAGTDTEAYIKEAMVASIKEALEEQAKNWGIAKDEIVFGQGETKEKDAEYINQLYDNISGFALQSNMIMFSFHKSTEEIYKQVYEVEIIPNENAVYAYSINMLPYKYLDPSKMTIFK